MSSRPGLAAVVALGILGCATKEQTTQTAEWQRQAKQQDQFMGDKRVGVSDPGGTRQLRKQTFFNSSSGFPQNAAETTR
jgi:hypothetical protein